MDNLSQRTIILGGKTAAKAFLKKKKNSIFK